MAVWPYMFGLGFGLIASVLTIYMTQRSHQTSYTERTTRASIPRSERTTSVPIRHTKVSKNSDPKKICAICYNDIEVNEEMKYLSCHHEVHKKCTTEYQKSKCDTCLLENM